MFERGLDWHRVLLVFEILKMNLQLGDEDEDFIGNFFSVYTKILLHLRSIREIYIISLSLKCDSNRWH